MFIPTKCKKTIGIQKKRERVLVEREERGREREGCNEKEVNELRKEKEKIYRAHIWNSIKFHIASMYSPNLAKTKISIIIITKPVDQSDSTHQSHDNIL